MIVTTVTATDIRTNSAYSGGNVSLSVGETHDYNGIVDHLLKQKFKLYNKARQTLSADIKRSTPLKPFSMFINTKDNNTKFFSIGYTWDILHDTYTIKLYEYDKDTTINLVEV